MKNIIKISDIAKTKLKQILNDHSLQNILFSVKSGGCSGLNYDIQPTNNPPKKDDEVISLDTDKHLIICKKSVFHVFGLEIDYTNNVLSSGFEFKNPNATNHCGCGKSFS